MDFIRNLAYGHFLGPLPVVAWVGAATYVLFLTTAALAFFGRRSKRLRRAAFVVHPRIALAAILLAAVHLVMALSIYV